MTLETILRTVLHAVAWSALVAFCCVAAGVGMRWMLSKLGHAFAETGRRCGKWATNDALNLTVSWPLECWFMETGEGTHAYYVGFNPRDPGGVFSWSWEDDEGAGGASLMSGVPDLLPRCFSAIGNYVWADCDGNCGCGGCQAEGTYRYAGRTVTVSGGDCGCVPHPPPPPEPFPPSVLVSFSDPVVFYEDEYDNTPANHVDRQSTTTILSVSASGGTLGTTLTLSADNLNKLTSFYGTGIPSFSYSIPPSGYVYFTVGYEGAWPSGAENDVTVSATVADRVNGGTLTSSCTTTVVRIILEAEKTASVPCRAAFT